MAESKFEAMVETAAGPAGTLADRAQRLRRGRPRKGEEVLVTRRIVAAATELFLERGFSDTSMDTVAAKARCSKRTLYTRFPSKGFLFESVMSSFMQERLEQVELSLQNGERLSLEHKLVRAGERALEVALTSEVVRLHRLLVCEGEKFPELPRIMEAEAWEPGLSFFISILSEANANADLSEAEIRLLAEQFFALVLERPLRRVTLGLSPPDVTPDQRRELRAAVRLFLRGCAEDLKGARG